MNEAIDQMTKIGILTYFNYVNYGSMLQGYATQKAFQKYLENPSDCVLINYRYQSPTDSSSLSLLQLRLKRLFHYIGNYRKYLTLSEYSSKLSQKACKFDEFRNKFTIVTDTFYRNKRQLQNDPPDFEVYVTGSDQTWSPIVSGGYGETPMFLDFAKKGAIKCAYAPSLGTANLNETDKQVLQDHIKNFEIISCRENSGVKLLKQITTKTIHKVLDPTLLLTGNEWREISIKPIKDNSPYILCYFIGDQDYYRDFANKLGQELNLPVYYIPVSWKDCKHGNKLLFDVGPSEFIGLIDNAKVVLTDSFHGTAFSSNLETPFYSFLKHSGGAKAADNSRIYDYLFSIGLENRLIEKYHGDHLAFSEIDFSQVMTNLQKQRENSLAVVKEIASLANRKC